jgi:predicted TIM-barrel fold metal-dependent hydrolase
MIDGMLVVDVHNHIVPPRSPDSETFYDTTGQTAEELIARMDSNGIDIAVVFPVNTGMLAHEAFVARNSEVIGALQHHPDRLVGFCTVSPLHGEAVVDEIERCFEQGIKGVKLHPRKHGGYPLNSEVLDPLMRVARKLDIPVLAHTDFNDQICTPYQARMLARRHPDVTLFLAHYGHDSGAVHWVPEVVADAENIMLECSGTPDLPQAVFNHACEVLGGERLVFGSDSPDLSPEVNLTKLQVAEEYYGLSQDAKSKILGENAARILKLER